MSMHGKSPLVSPRSSGPGGDSLRGDAVREALLSLTSKEPPIVITALEVLRRVAAAAPSERAVLHLDSGVQRLAFLVSTLSGGNVLKTNSTVVELALEALWLLVDDDESWAAVVSKECGSRVIVQLLRLHIASSSVARYACLLLVALSWHERNVGLVARLEGGIQLVLSLVSSSTASTLVVLPALELLTIYARTSDNNVSLLYKKDGFPAIMELMRRYSRTEDVLVQLLNLVTACCKSAKFSVHLGNLGMVDLIVTTLSSRSVSATIAECGVTVLAAMCSAPDNIATMWETGAFQVLWVVITRFAATDQGAGILKVASATLWKMLAAQGVEFPCDLNARETWDLPPFPPDRGCARYASRSAGLELVGEVDEASDSDDNDGKEDGEKSEEDFEELDEEDEVDDEVAEIEARGSAASELLEPSKVQERDWAPRHPSSDSLASESASGRSDTKRTGKLGRKSGKSGKRHRRTRSRASVDDDGKRSHDGASSLLSNGSDDSAGGLDGDYSDWFPELDDAAVMGDTSKFDRESKEKEAGFIYPATVSVSGDGVASTMPFKLESKEIPSAFNGQICGETEPMTALEPSILAALVQRMMLSVVARLALPRPSGGEVVYDRFEGVEPPDDEYSVILHQRFSGGAALAPPGLSVRLPSVDADMASPPRARPHTSSTGSLSHPVLSSPAAAAAAASAAETGADLSSIADTDTGGSIRRILADAAADAALRPKVEPLQFESRFECGNLRAAVRVGAREYDLLVAPDTNTGGHTQWFFFRVRGMQPGGAKYKFNIVNLEKADSTYNYGMRPLMYAVKGMDGDETNSFVAPGHGWKRCGEEICYFQNHYTKQKAGVALSSAANNAAALAASSISDAGSKVGGVGDSTATESAATGAPVASDIDDSTAGQELPASMPCYTFTFTVSFPEGTHTAFFAHCFPYSYSDLNVDLGFWERRANRIGRGMAVQLNERPGNNPSAPAAATSTAKEFRCEMSDPMDSLRQPASVMQRGTLCRTLSGNAVPLLTITDFNSPPEAIRKRPYIVLSARVHPGETNASWMMRGVLDFLTSTVHEANALRRTYIFKVVPFLNPDGVINGHHRTNLSGVDLNRHWTDPARGRTPTVYYLKRLLAKCKRRRDVPVFCDFHGHSRRKNIFIFGCDNTEGVPERLFPKLLDRRAPDFQYRSCSFKVQRSKANCARVAVWRDIGITNSYTIESSFAGSDVGPNRDMHFQQRHYEEMGYHFAAALLDMVDETSPLVVETKLALKELHPQKFVSADDKKRRKGRKKRVKAPIRKSGARSSGTPKARSSKPPKARVSHRSARR